MSRAFVKETENDTIGLPDRPISPHRNFVTEAGLADIEAALGRFESAHRAAVAYQTSGNPAFLTTAEAIATYFVDHLPTNTFIPPWDFDAPAGAPVDTSAA